MRGPISIKMCKFVATGNGGSLESAYLVLLLNDFFSLTLLDRLHTLCIVFNGEDCWLQLCDRWGHADGLWITSKKRQ